MHLQHVADAINRIHSRLSLSRMLTLPTDSLQHYMGCVAPQDYSMSCTTACILTQTLSAHIHEPERSLHLEGQVRLPGESGVPISRGVVHRDLSLCLLHVHHPQSCGKERSRIHSQIGLVLLSCLCNCCPDGGRERGCNVCCDQHRCAVSQLQLCDRIGDLRSQK